ncbi:hypothetical protein [Candidatus Steffania adelgidicola]|uniref:hypothetical protein n=1 Tax=Candidatus Steffania adelgidicola TaxID=1076626 RepID=UPI001D00EF14|nr:hypothetical protein [Candidatus Steffania adelgidicola]
MPVNKGFKEIFLSMTLIMIGGCSLHQHTNNAYIPGMGAKINIENLHNSISPEKQVTPEMQNLQRNNVVYFDVD